MFYPSSPPTITVYNKSSSTRVSHPLQKHCEATLLLPKILILATDVPFGRLFLIPPEIPSVAGLASLFPDFGLALNHTVVQEEQNHLPDLPGCQVLWIK